MSLLGRWTTACRCITAGIFVFLGIWNESFPTMLAYASRQYLTKGITAGKLKE